MIDILANHLYSSPDVFIRELLQNGTDAISGRKKSDPDFQEGKITIAVVPGESLTFSDNGSGLTKEEIHQFLAVIGQSSKRDLKTGKILEDYIGRFGIGMLSCFMVTDEIVLSTRSCKDPEHAYLFHGKPDGTYRIEDIAEPIPVGTQITIRAKKGCEQYFHEEKITELVRYYGLPLPFPVMLQGTEGESRINTWFQMSGRNAHESVMKLGEALFDTEFLDYIPLESKSGLFSGVAYIMPYAVAKSAKNHHRIYLKNMLLTEDGSAIMPSWSFFLRCFLNTSQLRPTASRESFYEDERLAQAREELSECISNYLIRLSTEKPELLQRIISVHFLAIKSMAGEDDTFFRTFLPFLDFETNMGHKKGKELLRYAEPIAYTLDLNQFHRTSSIMLAQNQLLINACYAYDTALLKKLQEEYEDLMLYPLQLVSFEEYLAAPNMDVQKDASFLLHTARETLAQYECDVQLKCFSPPQLPVFYVLDENAQIKRDIHRAKETSHALFSSMLDSFAEEIDQYEAVLYLNAENPLIQRLFSLCDREKLAVYLEILFVQALLTGRFPLRGGEMAMLNQHLIQLLEWGIGAP